MDVPRLFYCLRGLLAGLVCSVAAAQTPLPPTNPATYETPSTRETVTFGRRAPQVGDQVEQRIEVELALRTLTRQGSKILERGEQRLTRRQHRLITADRVEDGRTRAANVKFISAERQVDDQSPAAEPVVGKTYHCHRDGEQLLITTASGEIPPLREFRMVTPCMETLGRPHPLADFFSQRTVAIGEKILLPEEVARELLGTDEQFGEVSRFEMTLVRREEIEGHHCAVFEAEIEATGNGSSQMRFWVTGPMVLEVSTCRAISADFRGPIGMSEMHGTYGTRYQVDATGKFRVAVTSRYAQAKGR